MINEIDNIKREIGQLPLRTVASSALEHTSPLKLVLKLAAQKAPDITFTRGQRQDKRKDNWGRLASLKRYLKNLNLRSNVAKSELGELMKYYPGIPSCIMALYPIWHDHDVVISTAKDKFVVSQPLSQLAEMRRDAMLQDFRQRCSTEVQARVDAVEEISRDMMSWVEGNRSYEQSELQAYLSQYERRTQIPVYIPGLVATWGPPSGYMPACLLDHYRFRAHKPPAAEKREGALDQSEKQRPAFGHNTCAEWPGLWSGQVCLGRNKQIHGSQFSKINPTSLVLLE